MTFKNLLPQKFTNRIILLIGFLGVLTAAVNTSFTIYTNYQNTYEKVFNSIEIQYDIFSDDFAEAMLLEDIYSIYSEVSEINKSFDFISNIYVLDAKGNYFTDANATRKIPDNIPEDITAEKTIKAGKTTIGKIIFVLNKDEIHKGIFSDVSRLVFVNIFIVIMGVLLGIVLARFLSNPLKQLSCQISNINPLEIPKELHTPAFSSYEVEQLKNTLHDLSYRLKESISQIKQQQREINKAERLASIGTMAAGLAHELKNPIMSLKLISDTLNKEYADKDYNFKTDAEMLAQVLENLVQNSYEADAENIAISFYSENGKFYIKYFDNGEGFQTADREEIFRPFFTTKETGTGLGLAMCEKILENLGGSISVIDTNYGAGFLIEINQNEL